MTKYLGKKPPVCHHEQPCVACATVECQEHYRQALLEVAKKLEPHGVGGMSPDDAKKLIRRIRISAGEKDE